MARTPAWVALALVAGSLLVCWLALELAFVPLLPYLPLRLHLYLDEAIRPLAQSSKRGARPHDYVAIAGDSYAQGLGDWLYAADPDRNGPFGSAHVLHASSGRDVVSFGRGGTGALGGWAAFPRLSVDALAPSRRTALEPPALVIAYFYEGNDLEDTLAELVTLTIRETPALAAKYSDTLGTLRLMLSDRGDLFGAALRNPRLVYEGDRRREIETHLLPLYSVPGALEPGATWPRPWFARFLVALVQGDALRLAGHPPASEPPAPEPRSRNHAQIAGALREIPGALQGPGMELTPEETELSFGTIGIAFGELAADFPHSRLCLVQILSPAAIYSFADDASVSLKAWKVAEGEAWFPSAAIRARSKQIAWRLQELAARGGARFVDTTLALRGAARGQPIHGPRDWMHLNETGQRALAESVAGCLDAPPRR